MNFRGDNRINEGERGGWGEVRISKNCNWHTYVQTHRYSTVWKQRTPCQPLCSQPPPSGVGGLVHLTISIFSQIIEWSNVRNHCSVNINKYTLSNCSLWLSWPTTRGYMWDSGTWRAGQSGHCTVAHSSPDTTLHNIYWGLYHISLPFVCL